MDFRSVATGILLILIPLLAVAFCIELQIVIYKNSAYYRITKNPYKLMRQDKGRFGEYLTYKELRHFEKKGAKFLFNVYLPKGESETTEIDVLMIARNGLFVFESKNYSGWIFGDENRRMWTQTLPRGRGRRAQKERFLNPVWQNKLHIEALKQALDDRNVSVFSLIVFSDRCTLKNVVLRHNDIAVVHRRDVVSAGQRCVSDQVLSDAEISEFYIFLYPYSQATPEEKQKHVEDIRRALETAQDPTEPVPAEPPFTAEVPIKPQILSCPECGAALVRRTAKRGPNAGRRFWECSNYPACKYVRPDETEAG